MGTKAPVMDLVEADFDVVEITEEEKIKAGLVDLKKRFSEVSDPTTKEGYEKNRAGVAVMRALRSKVTAKIKEKKAPVLKKQKQLIKIEKWMLGEILALEDPMKEKNKVQDDKIEKEKFEKAKAETERVDAILAKIETIKMAPILNMDKSSTELQAILESTKNDSNNLSWADEHGETAQDIIAATTERLETLIGAKKAQEEADKQQAEAAKKIEADKKAAEDKAQAEREEQDLQNKEKATALAKEQAVFEKEKEEFRKAQEAKEAEAKKIEDDRLARIKKEDDEREAKELDRLAAIKKEADDKIAAENLAKSLKAEAEEKQRKEEEDEKQALLDAENFSNRKEEAAAAIGLKLERGLDEHDLINEIIQGEVPHVTFT